MQKGNILPFLFALVVSVWVASAKVTQGSIQGNTRITSNNIVPNRYIVEFDTTAHLSSAGVKRAASPHEAIYAQLDARGVSYKVHQKYDQGIFIGASLSLASQSDLTTLIQTTGVINISPVRKVQRPGPEISPAETGWEKKKNLTQSGVPSTTGSAGSTTTTVCTGKGKKQSCTTSTIASKPTANPYPTTGFSNLPQIQADKVQATGNKGKGIKIGIVDGGIDYTRTPFGGCFGAGCKVAGGYDFVGDNFNGDNDPQPDNDPLDQCFTHGNIVAGIIGANDNEYNVTGVAPEASLYSYRVYSCLPATTDDIIMAGMLRAYQDGMDVINLSLGETSGWTESPLSALASRLVSNGVVVVSSAGNHGVDGPFYAGSPADGVGVISAGGVDNAFLPALQATVSTGYGPITFYQFAFFETATYPLYAFNTDLSLDPNTLADGCDNSTWGDLNLSGYLVILRRGGCSLFQKAQNVYFAGGPALLVVSAPTDPIVYQNFPFIDFGTINNADGTYLLNQIAAKNDITVSFSFMPIALPNTPTGNLTSFLSTIGPTDDLFMSTQVLAPATNIIGVVPESYGNWTISDGTSWSSAFVSGSAALYLAAKGGNNLNPKTVREALENTAQELPVSYTDSSLTTVAAQGAGKTQIFDAINAGITVSPSELLLNDTANFNSVQYIYVTNNGKSNAQYTLSHTPAGTIPAYQQGLNQSTSGPVDQIPNAASVQISPSNFNLRGGQNRLVKLQFSQPTGLDPMTFPIYSGYIQVSGGGSVVSVPYLGVAATMKNEPVIDFTDYYGLTSPSLVDSDFNVLTGEQTYNYQGDNYPNLYFRVVGGTPLFLIDLVDANANLGFTPNVIATKRSFSDSSPTALQLKKRSDFRPRRIQSYGQTNGNGNGILYLWCSITHNKGKGCPIGSKNNTFAAVPILGNVWEEDYKIRDSEDQDGSGGDYDLLQLQPAQYTNGTNIANGKYKFLMRALKINGDPTQESDYEAWVSQAFTIAQ